MWRPQGSILGPLFFFKFLIFINDLPLVLQNYVVFDLYADDTTFYDFQFDIIELETNLQHVLNLLRIWCRQNGMVLNTDNTKVMLITSRLKRLSMQNPVLSLTYSDIDIKMTHADKILGAHVHVDDNLMWNNHFQHVSKKISSYVWLFSKIRSYLSVEHRLLLAHLSRRLKGELIGYSWSGVRPSSVRRPSVVNNFKHLLLRNRLPNQSQIFCEPPWVGGTKVCSRHLGHMTKMAATPIYGKNPSKIFFSRTGRPIFTKLGK